MADNARVHLYISGLVQGVFYRSTTAETGQRLGLKGWVRNLPDGRVEITAEGPREKLEELIQWCHSGPPAAKVDNVDAEWSQPRGGLDDFSVTYA